MRWFLTLTLLVLLVGSSCGPVRTVQTGHHATSAPRYKYPQYDGEHERPSRPNR